MTRGFVSGEREYDLWLGLDGRQDFGLNALQNLPIARVGGQTILLKMVATLERQSSLRVIRRENRETQLQVEFDLDGITPDEARRWSNPRWRRSRCRRDTSGPWVKDLSRTWRPFKRWW